MNTRKQPDSSNKLAILPMWVIDRIKEEMRLGPAAWQAITEAVEKAEVPQALPCEVKLPPGTVIGQGTAVSTLMLAIQQRASYPAQAQVFSSVEPEQPHPEPLAWMVGTAFWWTKEEAERDAAETGLPIVGLGPMTDTAEAERLFAANTEFARRHLEGLAEVERLRAHLAEALRVASQAHLALIGYLPAHRNAVTTAAIEACAALSASAEPSAPVDLKPSRLTG
ncbi:hypothetical protein [Pseudomonas putida]|nr:hypothetical protein [Pseudomonas putida]MCS4063657.1 hypothetical protein [Pseudomonas putida]